MRSFDIIVSRKEARGSPLFSYLNGVQVVAGSNPAAPTRDSFPTAAKHDDYFVYRITPSLDIIRKGVRLTIRNTLSPEATLETLVI